MGIKNFFLGRNRHFQQRVLLEKHLLEKHFNFLKVITSKEMLLCIGFYQPTESSPIYKYRIEFIPRTRPKVYVLAPDIVYDDDIHMYRDGTLCLYYPNDFSWKEDSHLYNTIVPWTHEWFVFYELYLITGKWHHPFVEHKKI